MLPCSARRRPGLPRPVKTGATAICRRRRDGYLASQQAKVSLHVDALLVQLGRRSFEVGPEDVQHPDGLAVISVTPTRVKLNVVQSPAVSSRSPGRKSGRIE
jgi:hypothetical protein